MQNFETSLFSLQAKLIFDQSLKAWIPSKALSKFSIQCILQVPASDFRSQPLMSYHTLSLQKDDSLHPSLISIAIDRSQPLQPTEKDELLLLLQNQFHFAFLLLRVLVILSSLCNFQLQHPQKVILEESITLMKVIYPELILH